MKPGRRIAIDGSSRGSLHCDAADSPQIRKSFELFSVPKRATGSNNGIAQADTCYFNRKIRRLTHIRSI